MTKRKLPVDSVQVNDVLAGIISLPDESVDLTITSPPYNKRKAHTGWLVREEQYSDFHDHLPEDEYQAWQIEVLSELFRVTKPGGSLFYNHKLRWVDGTLIHPLQWLGRTPWTTKQEIVWDRALAANMRGWRFWQVDERIYWLYKPVNGYLIGKELESRHAKLSSIWRFKPVPRMKEHPAPFPLEIPVRIIYSLLQEPQQVVFDPFCGTGTTLVAAHLLGHHFYGIDSSPSYVAFAQERLARAEEERALVNNECAKHVVGDPFSARKKRGTVTWPFGPKPNNGQPSGTISADTEQDVV
ncbi:MAG TPA: site-specific DNA-methyltransferase [Pyrinomonadaceae bacterium]